MYQLSENKLRTSRLSKVIVTDRQTDITRIIYDVASRVVNSHITQFVKNGIVKNHSGLLYLTASDKVPR